MLSAEWIVVLFGYRHKGINKMVLTGDYDDNYLVLVGISQNEQQTDRNRFLLFSFSLSF